MNLWSVYAVTTTNLALAFGAIGCVALGMVLGRALPALLDWMAR